MRGPAASSRPGSPSATAWPPSRSTGASCRWSRPTRWTSGLLDEISFMLSLHLTAHVGPEWRVRALIHRLYGGALDPRFAALATSAGGDPHGARARPDRRARGAAAPEQRPGGERAGRARRSCRGAGRSRSRSRPRPSLAGFARDAVGAARAARRRAGPGARVGRLPLARRGSAAELGPAAPPEPARRAAGRTRRAARPSTGARRRAGRCERGARRAGGAAHPRRAGAWPRSATPATSSSSRRSSP